MKEIFYIEDRDDWGGNYPYSEELKWYNLVAGKFYLWIDKMILKGQETRRNIKSGTI